MTGSFGRPSVVVLDYGFGNVRSAERALHRAGADTVITADFEQGLAADGLVVPGVGAFAACMDGLRRVRGEQLIDRRLVAGKPVLGICVGFQILFEEGMEFSPDPVAGCGQWPGRVEQLTSPLLPHMGWNTVEPGEGSALFDGIEHERFYFVHSFGVHDFELTDRSAYLRAPVVTWAEHGGDRFVAAVENGPLAATQFHPEKSGDAGAALLAGWVRRLNRRHAEPAVVAAGSRVDG
jgi:imidazole glycerol-phosphate synthase subunit HisH